MKQILSILLLSIVLILGVSACQNNCKKGNDACCSSKKECCDKKECKKGKCTPEDKCCDDCSGEPSKGKECCAHDAAATNAVTTDTTVTTEVVK
ncbi:MAG: hypothetical protein R2760_05210 [Chitinophagales bacterium]